MDAGIEVVVQLAYEEPPLALPREIAVCRIPLIDGGENDPRRLELAIRLVEQALALQLPTLVCCSAGLSRSPAIVAVALGRLRRTDPAACLAEVAALGPIDVSPALWNQIGSLNPGTS